MVGGCKAGVRCVRRNFHPVPWVLGKGCFSGWGRWSGRTGQTCNLVLLMKGEPSCSLKFLIIKGLW